MTSNLQNNPNQPPMFPTLPRRKPPLEYIRMVGDYMRAGMLLMFWVIAAALSIAVTVLALKAISVVSRLILQALGV